MFWKMGFIFLGEPMTSNNSFYSSTIGGSWQSAFAKI
jgi:hypothetical protein